MSLGDRESFLKDEYILLQQLYENIDNRCLNIKGWGITLVSIVIAAGIKISDTILFLGLVISIVFWYIEAFWRSGHYFLGIRIEQIEKAFLDNDFKSKTPFQIYSTWNITYKNDGSKAMEYFFRPSTYLPHLVMFLICLIIFVALRVGLIILPA